MGKHDQTAKPSITKQETGHHDPQPEREGARRRAGGTSLLFDPQAMAQLKPGSLEWFQLMQAGLNTPVIQRLIAAAKAGAPLATNLPRRAASLPPTQILRHAKFDWGNRPAGGAEKAPQQGVANPFAELDHAWFRGELSGDNSAAAGGEAAAQGNPAASPARAGGQGAAKALPRGFKGLED